MPDIHAVVESLRTFMATGGPVLWVIGAVAACMGFIIIERYWYVYLVFPASGRATLRRWQHCAGMAAAPAQRVRQAMVSEAWLRLCERGADDTAEGIAAFVEKRAPAWPG